MDYKIQPDDMREKDSGEKTLSSQGSKKVSVPSPSLREILTDILDLVEYVELSLYNKDISDEQLIRSESSEKKTIERIKAKINALYP